jgi:hypothetical protein
MPTERGLRLMAVSDRLVAELEHEYASAVGDRAYAQFLETLKALTGYQSTPRVI